MGSLLCMVPESCELISMYCLEDHVTECYAAELGGSEGTNSINVRTFTSYPTIAPSLPPTMESTIDSDVSTSTKSTENILVLHQTTFGPATSRAARDGTSLTEDEISDLVLSAFSEFNLTSDDI